MAGNRNEARASALMDWKTGGLPLKGLRVLNLSVHWAAQYR